jgi:hypothetical protein
MSLVCPHCRQPFTLAAVASSILATNVQPNGWRCPVHGSVKQVPAGISKKSGRAYQSFAACPEDGCSEKQPYGSQPAAPGPSAAPLPQYQAGDIDDLPF